MYLPQLFYQFRIKTVTLLSCTHFHVITFYNQNGFHMPHTVQWCSQDAANKFYDIHRLNEKEV